MLQRLTSTRDAVQVLRTATRRRLDDGAWHVWTVTLPRRSITGRLVWGTVWRRRDQGRWLYKRYVEPRVKDGGKLTSAHRAWDATSANPKCPKINIPR